MSIVTLKSDMRIQITSELALCERRGGRPVLVRDVPLTLFVDAHEAQCQRNHQQTLERIRERGGFSAGEAVCVLSCLHWSDLEGMSEAHAHYVLYEMIAAHNRGMRVAERLVVAQEVDETERLREALQPFENALGLCEDLNARTNSKPHSPRDFVRFEDFLNARAALAASSHPASAGDEGLLREVCDAQQVEPYRGWNLTALNKAADKIRERLGLPSIRDLNPDIAAMQDAATANKDAIRALSATPAQEGEG